VTTEPLLGWDLGGAHLKAARLDAGGAVDRVFQVACPLWQGLDHLHTAIDAAISDLGPAPRHAITMTGEMADLFPSRDAGVLGLAAAMRRHLPGSALEFYAGERGFVAEEAVAAHTGAIASANWLASAALVAARLPAALLVDTGSTTTDIIAVAGGRVRAVGRDDYQRLVSGELVYSGVVRTAVMAVTDAVPFGGDRVPLMAEYFATMADAYRVLGELPDGADLHPTADGGPRDATASRRRLARMIGRDLDSAPDALVLRAAQLERILAAAVRQVKCAGLPADAPVVGAGVGRFLVRDLAQRLGRSCVEFGELLPGSAAMRGRVADCAPAAAVAILAHARDYPCGMALMVDPAAAAPLRG
jgi:probable H4MPT-linked C1 transfer pathway protein